MALIAHPLLAELQLCTHFGASASGGRGGVVHPLPDCELAKCKTVTSAVDSMFVLPQTLECRSPSVMAGGGVPLGVIRL